MAGEISSAGVQIYYAPEATVDTCPSTGFKQKASTGTLNIADYVTGVSGLGADYDMYDVTPLSETSRHRFIKGLQSNDGSIELSANINPTSRADWGKIVAEFTNLTGGKSLWFEFILPGDTDGFFIRAEPMPMRFPDVEAGSAVQGAIQLVENKCTGFATKIVT
jgi:hypothetical protein